jgi:hypothetical protein
VNASWEPFDDTSCSKNHDPKEEQMIDDQKEQTIYQLLQKESSSRSMIDDNPCMPKKNMLLESDLELKLLLKQMNDSAEFLGTIDPVCHSQYLLSPKEDHHKLKGTKQELLKEKKQYSKKEPPERRKIMLAVNAILLDEEQVIQRDWCILLRTRYIATSAVLATALAMMMHYYGMMEKSHDTDAATTIVDGDARMFDTFKTFFEHN